MTVTLIPNNGYEVWAEDPSHFIHYSSPYCADHMIVNAEAAVWKHHSFYKGEEIERGYYPITDKPSKFYRCILPKSEKNSKPIILFGENLQTIKDMIRRQEE